MVILHQDYDILHLLNTRVLLPVNALLNKTAKSEEEYPYTLTCMDTPSRTIPSEEVWARGYKTFFMLNSTEHEIFPAHKC